MADAGAKVVISSRKADACDAVVREFHARGQEALAVPCRVVMGYKSSNEGALAVFRKEMDALFVSDTSANAYVKAGTNRAGNSTALMFAWLAKPLAQSVWVSLLSNSSGVVGLRCGQVTLAEYTWQSAAKPARSRMLGGGGAEPSATLSGDGANWCDTPSGGNVYFGNNSGTPGAANPACMPEAMTGTCVVNGVVRPLITPQAGELVITEVMANPSAAADTTGEWLEVLARASVDLNDVSIQTTSSSTRINAMDCLHVEPGDYVLLARSADPFVNGDLPPPKYVYGTISFADSTNQRIALARGDAGIDEIALLPGSSEIGRAHV